MAQFDFTTADGPIVGTKGFPNTRADINSALLALISNSSGDAEPTGTQANQFWYETDTNILKIRNEANSGWINVLTLDESMTVSASELNLLDDLTRGSILYGNASGATARLAKGAADTVLTSDGTDISWGAGAGGGATEFIASLDASNSATLSFTGFDDSKYDSYFFTFLHVTSANDVQNFQLVTSTDGGSNYDTGSADYNFNYSGRSTIPIGGADTDFSAIKLSFLQGTASAEAGGVSGHLYIYGPHIAQPTRTIAQTNYWNRNGVREIAQIGGERMSAADVNACRFNFSNGNIASGTITMYGIKNS